MRAQIKATQASIRESREKHQKEKVADLEFISAFWAQYKTFTGPTPRAKRSNDDSETSTNDDSETASNATKKLKTTHTESEISSNLDVMDETLARHCDESAVKFSKACVLWDSHERNSGLGAGEAYRDAERRRQIQILKYMGFEFNSSTAEVDQLSNGRIWLQSMLHQYAP